MHTPVELVQGSQQTKTILFIDPGVARAETGNAHLSAPREEKNTVFFFKLQNSFSLFAGDVGTMPTGICVISRFTARIQSEETKASSIHRLQGDQDFGGEEVNHMHAC